uniref:Small ribosomal subunit protein uS17 N-terminal domain-containing protein n=1 Tax=Salix viminalis TaxID=40686 RepID=A0A6N2L7J8_SALVM
MAEQTEKAFLKQPRVFLSSKKTGKGKRPGKGGNRFWKSIGLGFKTPRDAIEGTYIDKKCPFTGTVSVRGRILADMRRGTQTFPAHISPCFRIREGDHVTIGQCRPLSKTVRFNVLKVIPAGSSGGAKKVFTAIFSQTSLLRTGPSDINVSGPRLLTCGSWSSRASSLLFPSFVFAFFRSLFVFSL